MGKPGQGIFVSSLCGTDRPAVDVPYNCKQQLSCNLAAPLEAALTEPVELTLMLVTEGQARTQG